MKLEELFPEDKIILYDSYQDGDKIELLKSILDFGLKDTELERHKKKIQEALLERERSMSTGIGQGVAIPHCSTEFVTDVWGVLAFLKEGIDFQAVDGEAVRIVVLLLMPQNRFEKHIKTLASIAKLFNNETFRNEILALETVGETHQKLKDGSKLPGLQG